MSREWHSNGEIQGRQSVSNIVRVQSPSLPLPSPLLSSYSPPFRSPPFPPPLRSSPLNPGRGSGERSPSRQRFWCILRVKERCWWHSRCTVSNNRERLFLTLTTNLLWGSGPADSHGIDAYGEIAIFMVNRENSMVVPRGWPIIYGYPWQRQKKALLR